MDFVFKNVFQHGDDAIAQIQGLQGAGLGLLHGGFLEVVKSN